MACSIHLHTEVKIGGTWWHYGCPNVERNYRVFAKMADVRNCEPDHYLHVEPIALPRGLPSNASLLTRFDHRHWGSDAHSASWLSAEEITCLVKYIDEELGLQGRHGRYWWCEDNFGYFFGNTWGGFWEYRNHENSGTPEGVQDVRFIFWFDN